MPRYHTALSCTPKSPLDRRYGAANLRFGNCQFRLDLNIHDALRFVQLSVGS